MADVAAITDGRAARGARTREAVVEALLGLLEEGVVQPTARRVAERAGVSTRTVFHHFSDLETLFAAAVARQGERQLRVLAETPPQGPLFARLAWLVDRRARLYEGIRGVRSAAVSVARFSPTIADGLARSRDRERAQIVSAFGPELSRRSRRERDEVVAALVAITSWETWESLRRHQGLSVEAAKRVLALMIGALTKEEA